MLQWFPPPCLRLTLVAIPFALLKLCDVMSFSFFLVVLYYLTQLMTIIYWTWAYARVCKSGGALLATYPTCWVVSPVHLVGVAGWCTVDIPLHPHLSACLVVVALMYAGLQTNIS